MSLPLLITPIRWARWAIAESCVTRIRVRPRSRQSFSIRSMISSRVHNVPDGSVRVTTEMADGCAVLSVDNTGPVIPPEDVPRLLRPFQRAGTERIGTPGGLGLGLSIVAAIAESHGGWLRATARPEGGLTVQAGLPEAYGKTQEP